MLRNLKRWFGWKNDSQRLDSTAATSSYQAPSQNLRTATRDPSAVATDAPPRMSSAAPSIQRPADPSMIAASPKLSLTRPESDGFDPYNTGAFNRSQSWEKIGWRKR